jgi:hypothetical protein
MFNLQDHSIEIDTENNKEHPWESWWHGNMSKSIKPTSSLSTPVDFDVNNCLYETFAIAEKGDCWVLNVVLTNRFAT